MKTNNERRSGEKILKSKRNKCYKNIKKTIIMKLPIILFLVILMIFIFISLMDVFFWEIIKSESNILILICWQFIGLLIGIVVFALSKAILNFYITIENYLETIADAWEEN